MEQTAYSLRVPAKCIIDVGRIKVKVKIRDLISKAYTYKLIRPIKN